MYLVVVEADWNDGDYVTNIWETSQETVIKVKKFCYDNRIVFPLDLQDLSNEDQELIDTLENMVGFPSAPDPHKVHSIEDITFYKIEEKITL